MCLYIGGVSSKRHKGESVQNDWVHSLELLHWLRALGWGHCHPSLVVFLEAHKKASTSPALIMIRLMSTGQRAPTPVPAVVQVQPQLVNLPAVPVAIPPPKYHTQVSVASIDQEQFKTEDAKTVQQ